MAEKMVAILVNNRGVGPRTATHSRMMVPESEAKDNPRYKIDETPAEEIDAPCFDGLSAAQKKKVLAKQAVRQKRIEEIEAARKKAAEEEAQIDAE